jgi:hypothetical protein
MNSTEFPENPNGASNEDSRDDTAAGTSIIASKVPNRQRLSFLPRYLGSHMLMGEALVYAALESMSDDYNGGYWEFYDLSNGGFYMAPAIDKKLRLTCSGNYFDGEVSADAAGIIATLMALNQLSWQTRGDHYIRLFYLLRDFATEHPESALILRAID